MFEIRCIVGDKQLAKALSALHGKTLDPPVVLPVAMETADRVDNLSGNSVEMIGEFLKSQKGQLVTAKQLRELVSNGESKGHGKHSYALNKFLRNGTLKKTRKTGVYEVVA